MLSKLIAPFIALQLQLKDVKPSQAAKEKCARAAVDLPLKAQEKDFSCGAACVRSLIEYFTGEDVPEEILAHHLGTNGSGTMPENILRMMRGLGLYAEIADGKTVEDLYFYLRQGEGLIAGVTSEGEAHWSAVRAVTPELVEMMDPWVARKGKYQMIPREIFLKEWNFQFGPFLRKGQVIRVSRTPLLEPTFMQRLYLDGF